ncbi:MBL fold metallo-hydrolase [Cellulosimicrobium marinum]|uniref:MBL fold metallo-hydrolase n=1 Tax=Cellulosimicrobium marinum TaxID=1638992 RepID=UPI001E5730FB|nr:MBL fold metallo-hydrolase [Cellulosimicrobium marinum]MCB7137730.1 MBL fold metallo-hydrolase [Cellulosimicrobium marinum]
MGSSDGGGRTLVEVVPGVHVSTARLWDTTSTLVVGPGGDVLLVDPGVSVAECAALARTVADRGWRVTAGFSTHPHWDHVLWHGSFGRVPRWATARAVATVRRRRARTLAATEAEAPGHDPSLVGALDPLPDGATSLPWSGGARVVEHDAHAPGHAALVVAGALLAGDMLSDVEVPLLDPDAPDAVATYRAALDLLAEVARDVAVVVPGHGAPAVGEPAIAGRLAADRRYLDALERAAAGGPDVADHRLSGYVADWHAEQLAALRG